MGLLCAGVQTFDRIVPARRRLIRQKKPRNGPDGVEVLLAIDQMFKRSGRLKVCDDVSQRIAREILDANDMVRVHVPRSSFAMLPIPRHSQAASGAPSILGLNTLAGQQPRLLRPILS